MKTPVMMVHGVSCTGEVWTHFRSFFEARGVRVYTPTLRPELRVNIRQKPPAELAALRFVDYVEQLEREIQHIELQTGLTPAVIGHSMGGLLAQALAERNKVAASVFISPSPPAGVHTPSMRLFWGAWRTAHRFGFAPKIMRPDRRTTKRLVFNVMPIEQHAIARGAMVYESGHAFNDLGNVLIDETKIQAPVLTIAATRDRLVPARSVRLTGRKYAAIGGEFKEYRNHGHWLYAEPNWEEPAGDIYAWLSKVTQSRDTDREVHSRTDSDRETQPRTDTDRAALE